MAAVHNKRVATDLPQNTKHSLVKKAPTYDPRTHRLLVCLNKMRASLAIGGPLFSSGRYKQSKALFTRVTNEVVSPANRFCLQDDQASSLEEALVKSSDEKLAEDAQTWTLRAALDKVYDANVNGVIGDDGVYFQPFYHKIRESLDQVLCAPDHGVSQEASKAAMLKVVDNALADQGLHLSEAIVNLLVDASRPAQDDAESVKRLKLALFTLYDAIRLPDLNPANRREAPPAKPPGKAEHELMADFSQAPKDDVISPLSHYIITDSVMGGLSEAAFSPATSDTPYALFKGNLCSGNGGGFASVRFTPTNEKAFHALLDNCVAFVVVLKCLGSDPLKIKMKLSSEKKTRAFNWQSEITVPCNDFASIKVPVTAFWPNLFGHVVADKGSVDFKKVDSVGFIVSRLSEDGTSNQSFSEGDFNLAVKSISVLRESTSA